MILSDTLQKQADETVHDPATDHGEPRSDEATQRATSSRSQRDWCGYWTVAAAAASGRRLAQRQRRDVRETVRRQAHTRPASYLWVTATAASASALQNRWAAVYTTSGQRIRKAASPSFHPSRRRMDSSDLDLHLIYSSSGPPVSASQTASRSVQPFFARLANVTNRQNDRAINSVCSYRCEPTMRPNKLIILLPLPTGCSHSRPSDFLFLFPLQHVHVDLFPFVKVPVELTDTKSLLFPTPWRCECVYLPRDAVLYSAICRPTYKSV